MPLAYHWAVKDMSRLLFSFKWSWVKIAVDVTMPPKAADTEDDRDEDNAEVVVSSEASEISDEEDGLEAVGESRGSACLRSIS